MDARKSILNKHEKIADSQLRGLETKYDVHLFKQLGLRECLNHKDPGLTHDESRYAFYAHFDFVIADAEDKILS